MNSSDSVKIRVRQSRAEREAAAKKALEESGQLATKQAQIDVVAEQPATEKWKDYIPECRSHRHRRYPVEECKGIRRDGPPVHVFAGRDVHLFGDKLTYTQCLFCGAIAIGKCKPLPEWITVRKGTDAGESK